MSETWGILSPADLASSRRLQSLGLTRAVRRFNERAVPGMGGLWFTMPLVWSMLGIAVAHETDKRPISAANAVEALAMKLALAKRNDGEPDGRLRGRRNLGRTDGWSFAELARPGSYVTQPFRQTCTQPLVTLGLVEGSSARFNSFRLRKDAERLLALLPGLVEATTAWVEGRSHEWRIHDGILPRAPLPEALRADIGRRIYGEGADAARRKTVRDHGRRWTSQALLDQEPAGVAADHLVDLRGGIATVRLRDAALRVLGAVEARIAARRDAGHAPALTLTDALADETIRERIAACVAQAAFAAPHIEAAKESDSLAFLKDCRSPDGLLERLARRDGVVIVLRDDVLAPGPAFGAAPPGQDDQEGAPRSDVPELPRIANLLALTDDLAGGNQGRAAA